MKPLIGIQVRKLADQNEYRLNHKYPEAIYAGGAIPIMLPLIPARDYLEAVLAKLDGIIMSGCYSDVDPKLYGETPHPKLGPISEVRDQFDWLLLEYAHARHIPLLGICRGLQALNVFRGGTLFQDLSSQKPTAVEHDPEDAEYAMVHEVRLAPRSVLNSTGQEISRPVTSLHHQAIKEIGKGLKPIAWAPDGLVEAVQNENLSDHFIYGVQWHPERTWEVDDFSLSIFQNFAKEVVNRKKSEKMER
ncbi:MAG: gamma-glutamyl-gamma-aminobutyrate hydrolase family protein [candidate division KSB1 bacterium]|nr:gamma-glutamyl-gamma-aminobutyrate hydrolase family protein [candidate division KSB1 bacterium]